MIVIGFMGLRRAGKSTACNEFISLASDMGLTIRKCSFADTLRQEFSKKTGIAVEMLASPTYKEEFREKLIKFGEDKRKADPKVFINAVFDGVGKDEIIALDDLRFINELQAVMERKGHVYQVYTDRKIKEARGWKYIELIDESPSETELRGLSRETMVALNGDLLYNNGTVEDLKKELRTILKKKFIKIPV